MLLMDEQEANHESDSEIQQSIQQVQQIVDTFLEGQSEGDIDPEARAKIKNFIDQISCFQDNLRKEKS